MTTQQIAWAAYRENKRHNQAMEGQEYQKLAETQLHNRQTENIQDFSAREQARANQAREGETHYRNAADIQLGWAQYGLGQQNQQLQEAKLAEQVRATGVAEEQKATELAERERHQKAQDQISYFNYRVNQNRANTQNEVDRMRAKSEADLNKAKQEDLSSQGTRRTVQNVNEVVHTVTDVYQMLTGGAMGAAKLLGLLG